MKPTIYLTNWSSRALHGPGRKLTIMARPRTWEMGEGYEMMGQPSGHLIRLMQAALVERRSGDGHAALDVYRDAMNKHWRGAAFNDMLRPGHLPWARHGDRVACAPVDDGDTLLCACARGAECHRRWYAPHLVAAGWRVILDGVEVG